VVDDNATNGRILVDILSQWQMHPTAVASGAAALAALKEAHEASTPFPLVLLDAHTPEMDGFDLAAQITRHPELTRATIMMLTSGGQRGDAARCRKLGIAAYLTKPITQGELWAAIRARDQTSGRHLAIVAMTVYAMKGDQERCLAAGMDGYVSEPLKRDELDAVIMGIREQRTKKQRYEAASN
jgi:CheY-like chemotaxis protein